MLDRIIEITDRTARLRAENRLLVIEIPGRDRCTVPLEEVGVLLLAASGCTVSGALLSQLAANNAMVVTCDEKHLPAGMLLPTVANTEQTARFATQAELPQPRRKRLWKEIVVAKIRNQGLLLRHFYDDDAKLPALAEKVRSGDPENQEGRAARIYWQRLQLVPRRERMAEDANRLLNYGYAVLLACCARAICSAGLHPSLGLHHHNTYNPFCLASDLMEPYRVLIDHAACRHLATGGSSELDRAAKTRLIEAILHGEVKLGGRREQLFRALTRHTASLYRAMCGEGEQLLPEPLWNDDDGNG